MPETLRIRELSRRTGIPIPQLRLFLTEGVIECLRTPVLHTRFALRAVEQAEHVQKLREQNVPFAAIREQIGWAGKGPEPEKATLSIGKLAQKTELTISTLRYYEQEGLLACDRSQTGRRQFPAEAVEQVRRIRHYRALDLPPAQIRRLLEWTLPPEPPEESRAILARRLEEVLVYKRIFEDVEVQLREWLEDARSE
jgi:DNA-binding transcriptional MerR regulator